MDDWTVVTDHVFAEPETVERSIGLWICPTLTPTPPDVRERVWDIAAEFRAGMTQHEIDKLRQNARGMREKHPEADVDEVVVTVLGEDECMTWDEFERRLALHAVTGSTTESEK